MFPFERRGLRVLMYHRTALEKTDALTVTPLQLDQQLGWLRDREFTFVSIADVLNFLEKRTSLPPRPVLVTFDDALRDTFELARPVLQRLQACAAVFVPTAFVGGRAGWDADAPPLMSVNQLAELAASGWELALHSHRHRSYAELSPEEIGDDLRENFAAFHAWNLRPAPAFAFPYGHRPRDSARRVAMQSALRDAGVRLAFRIGNRINPLPLRGPFEINRLGIRGDESFGAFQRKIRWGRLL